MDIDIKSASTRQHFTLNHHPLAAALQRPEMLAGLEALPPFSSQASFNHYCQSACALWDQWPDQSLAYPQFPVLLQKIQEGAAHTFGTDWGGVAISRHEPPQVEKHLVIRKGGYLALEKHTQKQEHIRVEEGAGLLIWRKTQDQPLHVELLTTGATYAFSPGIEHCVIATEDLLIFETATDPKGMDQDLIFIYTPVYTPV